MLRSTTRTEILKTFKMTAVIGGFAAAVLSSPDAMASSSGDQASKEVLTTTEDKIKAIFNTTWNIAMILGAFGLIVLSIMAFFGRFRFQHLLAFAGGMFLLGVTNPLINFLLDNGALTGSNIAGTNSK